MYLPKKIESDFNKMSELYEFVGENELAQFCGTWPLGNRVKSIEDLSNKLIHNLLNKGQLVPEKQEGIEIPEKLYPSLKEIEIMEN